MLVDSRRGLRHILPVCSRACGPKHNIPESDLMLDGVIGTDGVSTSSSSMSYFAAFYAGQSNASVTPSPIFY
jgi:hypothetical protein